MDHREPKQPGDIRFTDIGDVEVFDGLSWQAVESLLDDNSGIDRQGDIPSTWGNSPA